jgi:hypothetical protein
MKNMDRYRTAVFIVEIAMRNPMAPRSKGPAMCQKRSPVTSECQATINEVAVPKIHGGAQSKRLIVGL